LNIGKILGLAKSKHLILRTQEWDMTKNVPDIGDIVYTAEKNRVGVIADIFGPITKPFISIKLVNTDENALENYSSMKGASLFTLPSKPRQKGTKSVSTTEFKKYPGKKSTKSFPKK